MLFLYSYCTFIFIFLLLISGVFNRVWSMKFCYLGCEIPFLTNIQKEEVTQGWPHPGGVAQYGLGGIQCQGSVQLLPFMSFEFNFFIPASLSANSV